MKIASIILSERAKNIEILYTQITIDIYKSEKLETIQKSNNYGNIHIYWLVTFLATYV